MGALFDLRIERDIRETLGNEVYKQYMRANANEPFKIGPAFSLIAKKARFNKPDDLVYQFSILSSLSLEAANRLHLSLAHYKLADSFAPTHQAPFRVVYGRNAVETYLTKDCGKDIILSTRQADVEAALEAGIPAGHIDPNHISPGQETDDLVLCWDFDRVLAIALPTPDNEHFHLDNEEYTRSFGQHAAWEREGAHGHLPAHPTPHMPYFVKHFAVRDYLRNDTTRPNMKVAGVTARTNKCLPRVETTLKALGCVPDDLRSTGYNSKGAELAQLKADEFYDDGLHHIADTRLRCPEAVAIHIPWTEEHVQRIVRDPSRHCSRAAIAQIACRL